MGRGVLVEFWGVALWDVVFGVKTELYMIREIGNLKSMASILEFGNSSTCALSSGWTALECI